MNFFDKLQNLPERTRRIILWVIVIIVGLGLLWLLVKNFQKELGEFKMEEFKEELNVPSLEEELKNIPKLLDEKE